MIRSGGVRSIGKIWRKTTSALRSARIFLSHSWVLPDCRVADAIALQASREYIVQYDRSEQLSIGSSVIELGEPVVPLDSIFGCDFFLFVASDKSFSSDSFAYGELQAALNFGLWSRGRIGIVAVDDYIPPSFYRERLFERVRSDNLAEDCERVVLLINRRLLSLGGVIELPGRFIGGATPALLLDRLLNFAPRVSLYEMDLPLQKWATNHLMYELEKLGKASLGVVVGKLFDIMCTEGSALAKNNAIYMISRLQSGDQGYGAELLRFGGLNSDPYSRLSLATASAVAGRGEVLRTYLSCLLSETTEGRNLRRAHREYHIFYYGGYREAINALRKELVAKLQPSLLSLTVCTYSLLEDSKFGIELLRAQTQSLIENDVEKFLIRRAGERLKYLR